MRPSNLCLLALWFWQLSPGAAFAQTVSAAQSGSGGPGSSTNGSPAWTANASSILRNSNGETPFDLNKNRLSNAEILLLNENRYRLQANGNVLPPDSDDPVGRSDMTWILQELTGRQKLKALLQLDMIFNRFGYKNLPPAALADVRRISRQNWAVLPKDIRADLKQYFTPAEMEGLSQVLAPVTSPTLMPGLPKLSALAPMPVATFIAPAPGAVAAPAAAAPTVGAAATAAVIPQSGTAAPAPSVPQAAPAALPSQFAALPRPQAMLPTPEKTPEASAPSAPAPIPPALAALPPSPPLPNFSITPAAPKAETPAPTPAVIAAPAVPPSPPIVAAVVPAPPVATAVIPAPPIVAAVVPASPVVTAPAPAPAATPAAAIAPAMAVAPSLIPASVAAPSPAVAAAMAVIAGAAKNPAAALASAQAAPQLAGPAPSAQPQAMLIHAPPAPPPAPAGPEIGEYPEMPKDAFERFIKDAPYGHEVAELLKLVSVHAPEDARRPALGVLARFLPQIVIDPARSGQNLRADTRKLQEDPYQMASTLIVLSRGPVHVKEHSFLFIGAKTYLLPVSQEFYGSRGVTPPPLQAASAATPPTDDRKTEWGLAQEYPDGSQRLRYSKEELAGTLLYELLKLDARLRRWDLDPYRGELRARSAEYRFFYKLRQDTGQEPALSLDLRTEYAQWLETPEDHMDFVLQTLASPKVDVVLSSMSGTLEQRSAWSRRHDLKVMAEAGLTLSEASQKFVAEPAPPVPDLTEANAGLQLELQRLAQPSPIQALWLSEEQRFREGLREKP